jgi:hypothetical protein
VITSNEKYPLGPKIATIETPSFYCLIATIQGGISITSSIRFVDFAEGFTGRRLVAQLHYPGVAMLVYSSRLFAP